MIWGLLDDIWYFYHGKTSPYMVNRKGSEQRRGNQCKKPSIVTQRSNFESFGGKSASGECATPEQQPDQPLFSVTAASQTGSYANLHSRSPHRGRQVSQANYGSEWRNRSMNRTPTQISQKAAASPGTELASKTRPVNSPKSKLVFPQIGDEAERLTRIWLKALNLTVLSAQESGDLLRDPYRNGLLLCEVFFHL